MALVIASPKVLIRIYFQHVLDHQHEIVAASVTGIRQDFNKIDCWSQQIWHPAASIKGRRRVPQELLQYSVAMFKKKATLFATPSP
jgi:hypothetical protein